MDLSGLGQQVAGIVKELSSAITSGILTVGERLPTEVELAGQYNVAVATLRKALSVLRDEGIVETRRGRNGGTFIVKAPFPTYETLSQLLREMTTVSIRDFADEHVSVSGMTARLAAERFAPSSRTRLAEFAFRAREAKTMQENILTDTRFHIEIAVLSQSPRLLASEQRLQSEVAPYLWCTPLMNISKTAHFAEHLQIVTAIETKDPVAAQRLAEMHVRNSLEELVKAKIRLIREDQAQEHRIE